MAVNVGLFLSNICARRQKPFCLKHADSCKKQGIKGKNGNLTEAETGRKTEGKQGMREEKQEKSCQINLTIDIF